MSWQDQGRQYHMWFGSGHAPVKLKPIVEKDGSTTEQALEERLRTVVHGAIAALPRKFRPQAEAQFQSGTLETLTEAMAAWIYGGKMDAASFAHHFFDRDADDPVVASLRAAVSETVEAETRPQLAAASGHLADAIKTVGVDNWPRFVADARRRAHFKATLAAIEKSRQPVMSVSARVGGAGSGGGGKGARLAMAVEGKPAAGPVEELLQDLGLAHGGGAAPEAAEGAPAAGATEAPAPKPAAAEKPAPQTAGAKGEPPKPAINLGDTKTWPTPPGKHGPYAEGKPSRAKPASRGEKSLYDSMGGEWRLHLPDDYHEEMHWDYKPPGNNQQWQQFDLNGKTMK